MKARVPKNYGGVPGNMQGMIQQAQKMQEEITKKQAEIDEMEFKSSVGGGVVEVVISGKKEVKAVNIKPEIVDPQEIEMLQDLIVAATNEALRQAEEESSAAMAKLTGGLGGLGGGFPF